MRLTEEQVQVLTTVRDGGLTMLPAELLTAIEDCLHEGWIKQDESRECEITGAGLERLQEIEARLFSADQLNLHEEVKVAFVSQRSYERFQRLRALGLAAGVPIRLRQRIPSYVVQCEETEIALEEDIAKDIFVWRD